MSKKTSRKRYGRTSGYRSNSNGYIWNEEMYAKHRKEEVEARDNIVAIGYAERQIADSLRLAGKVNTEL